MHSTVATQHGSGGAEGLADQIADRFAQGLSTDAGEVLLAARARGLAWEEATLAVADGLARHYGGSLGSPGAGAVDAAPVLPSRRDRFQTAVGGLLFGLGLYVVLRPLFGLGHETAAVLLAWLCRTVVASEFWGPVLSLLAVDPVYGGAAIRYAGSVDVQGLSVAGAAGIWLHAVLPGIFQDPSLVMPGAGVSAVFAPGATLIGRALVAFGADLVWIIVGLSLMLMGLRRQRGAALVAIGLLVQGQIVINHWLDAEVAIGDLEASGLPFAVSLISPDRGAWFTQHLAALPDSQRAAVIGGTLVALGYGCVLALCTVLFVSRWLFGRAIRMRWGSLPAPRPVRSLRRFALLAGSVPLALAVAASPVGSLAVGESTWRQAHVPTISVTTQEATAADLAFRSLEPRSPSRVSLERTDAGWQYLVNGTVEVIRGVGYSPRYAGRSDEERRRLYARDFAAMRQVGVNTIEGWVEAEFDTVTLDAAAANGIGVLLPFELDRGWNYADPRVQDNILARVDAWVARYKDHPALRMWAPGNEDLHGIISPTWASKEGEPQARAQADAFAAFLVRLVDHIHTLDPRHPVVYRDAEDLYWPRLRKALQRDGVPRPWLVYGTNVYAEARLRDIIDTWPKKSLGGPLLVSEFGPGGMGPTDRPMGYRRDWQHIRSAPGYVLGGLAYTWTTDGPEELDRVFGLVHANGLPCDGALAALGAAYLADQPH